VPADLSVDRILSQFGQQRAAAQCKYQRFANEGIDAEAPRDYPQGQAQFGIEGFVDRRMAGLRDRPVIRLPTEAALRWRSVAERPIRRASVRQQANPKPAAAWL